MAYTGSPETLDVWLRAGLAEAPGPDRIVPGLGLHKLDGRSLERHLKVLDRGGMRSYALFSSRELMANRSLREAIRRFGGIR
jgi:hypothetical protein